MGNRKFLWLIIGIALICGTMVIGCTPEPEEEEEIKIDNTIYSVLISLGYNNDPPKVGSELSTSVKNKDGSLVTGVTYQWKRGDAQNSTFLSISNATSYQYTPTNEDADKYIKVEVKNNDTVYPVESVAVGPVDSNRVTMPTADPAGGNVISGHEIILTSATQYTTIYYTLNGTSPTSSSTQYGPSRPIITSNCTLKAIATKYGMIDSEVLSASYTVIAAPSFSSVTSSASIFTDGIYSIAYGNNRFVAGGSGRIAYSSNGTTWTASTGNSNFRVDGITYGSGLLGAYFVAVGSSGTINYSSDGISWTNVADNGFGTSSIYDVAYGGGRYVAVGDNGKIAYSEAIGGWSQVTDSTFGTSLIYGITYAAGKFVAVGANGKMAYSTDGLTWTAVIDSTFETDTIASNIFGITYGGPSGKEIFVAVGYDQIAYSSDGITWTSVSQYFNRLNRIVWGGNKFVAVASSGIMYLSLDGIYWTPISGGTGTGKTQFDTSSWSSINDIVYAGGKFLAVGIKSTGLFGTISGEMAISN